MKTNEKEVCITWAFGSSLNMTKDMLARGKDSALGGAFFQDVKCVVLYLG